MELVSKVVTVELDILRFVFYNATFYAKRGR